MSSRTSTKVIVLTFDYLVKLQKYAIIIVNKSREEKQCYG